MYVLYNEYTLWYYWLYKGRRNSALSNYSAKRICLKLWGIICLEHLKWFCWKLHCYCWHPHTSQTSTWNQFQSLIKISMSLSGSSDLLLYQQESPPNTAHLPPASVLLYLSVLSGVFLTKPSRVTHPSHTPHLDTRLTQAVPIYRQHSACPTGSLLCSRTLCCPSGCKMFVHAEPSTCSVFHSHLSLSKSNMAPAGYQPAPL